MLCIYVERCFESLICWLDLRLSSLLVAFISLCFSSLKNSFFQARQLLDKSSTNSLLSSLSFFFSRQILTKFRSIEDSGFLLDRILIASSIHRENFLSSLSGWLILNNFLIHQGIFAIDRSFIAPRQIHFCWDLVLDRYFDPSSCYFLIYAEHELLSVFFLLLSRPFSLSLLNISTHYIFGLYQAQITWYVF